MKTQLHSLDLFADYFQFYVCDGHFETDTSTLWDEVATDRMLAVGADLVAVGTARNMDVPLKLEVHDVEPASDISEWDQVIDCGLSLSSGTVIAFGCTENPDDAKRFSVQPGSYKARVSYANLNDLSADGLEGNDLYRVQLWPGEEGSIAVVKQRSISE
ncbi:hypothetical protein [Sphingomonas sp. NFX23]|uniref:hypothetical protein n=1 Tax=Sphingomonas sp. NFX23 TaxID=2819532 RepID=UPI003CEDDFA6